MAGTSVMFTQVLFQLVRPLIVYPVIKCPWLAPSVHSKVADVFMISTTCRPPGGPGGPSMITNVRDEIAPTADFTTHSYSPASENVALMTVK